MYPRLTNRFCPVLFPGGRDYDFIRNDESTRSTEGKATQ